MLGLSVDDSPNLPSYLLLVQSNVEFAVCIDVNYSLLHDNSGRHCSRRERFLDLLTLGVSEQGEAITGKGIANYHEGGCVEWFPLKRVGRSWAMS